MSDDILDRIDSAVSEAERAERWSKRFDPFGADDWDEDRVDRWGDGMRVRPAGAGIEEEAAEPGAPAAFDLLWTVPPAPRQLHMAGDWRQHDVQPADGDWPGGPRYGFTRDRVFRERRWTPEEHDRAAELGIALPEMDWRTVELWWDMPRMNTVEVERFGRDEPIVFSPNTLIAPTEEATFRRTVRTAKRYGITRWDTDPFGAAPASTESSTPPVADRTDPVADAFREEVLRQGLSECEIDGMREIYEDGRWRPAPTTRAFTMDNRSATFTPGAPDEGPHRHECEHPGCGWSRTAWYQPHLADLVEAHDLEAHTPWWRRIWRSR